MMQKLHFILFLPTMDSFQTGFRTLLPLYILPKKTNLTENIIKKRSSELIQSEAFMTTEFSNTFSGWQLPYGE